MKNQIYLIILILEIQFILLHIIQIEKKTSGPYQTILSALKKLPDYKNIIICDCDHHINIKPIIEKINNKFTEDIIIPVWDIEYEEQYRWGKIVINKLTNEIVKICEKELVEYDDNIDIFGWLNYPMQIKVNFLCRDSILAAPIVLDLIIFMDLALRSNMSGIQEWMSFYFKSPMHAENLYPEHDLFIQSLKLKNTLRVLAGEKTLDHTGLDYYYD